MCLTPGVNYSRRGALTAVLLALIGAGCTSTNKTTQTTSRDGILFAVTTENASFFRHGPRPGRDPDLKLAKDAIVKLIRPSFGYSKVQLVASGEQGYVASEDIRPAPSTLIAAATPAPMDSVFSAPSNRPAGEQFNLNSNDPRLVPPPEQLPNSEVPLPAPTPGE
jgi:hypothetical protein